MSEGRPIPCVDNKPHDFVDKVVQAVHGWSTSKRLVIYCRRCGRVTYDHYM